MKFDLSNLLNISARASFAASVACVLILFFPAHWLPFPIDAFRNQHGLWIFIVMVVAGSISFSHATKWGIEKIKKAVEKKKLWDTYRDILKNLSNDEKRFIKQFYEKRETAILLDLSDPRIKRLETFKVLSQAAGTSLSRAPFCPGFIQPWVFELIDKNPDFIKVEDMPYD